MFLFQNSVHRRKIEIQLTGVFRLKLPSLQFDNHIAAQIQIIEKQVNVKIITTHVEVILVAEKCKSGSELKRQFGYVLD